MKHSEGLYDEQSKQRATCLLRIWMRPLSSVSDHTKNDFDGLSKLSKEWESLFGFHLEPENLKCDSCRKESGRRVDKSCPVRPCCGQRGFETCAECTQHPCDPLKKRFVDRNEIENELSYRISDETYTTYVKPFENKARLDKIRQQHSP